MPKPHPDDDADGYSKLLKTWAAEGKLFCWFCLTKRNWRGLHRMHIADGGSVKRRALDPRAVCCGCADCHDKKPSIERWIKAKRQYDNERWDEQYIRSILLRRHVSGLDD